MKLGRKYKLLVELENGKAIEIVNPISCQFDIQRNAAASLNNGTFRVYNLSPTNRNQLFQPRVNAARVGRVFKRVVFQGGYDNLTTCFVGNVLEAYSYRQGVDIITVISCQDGGYGAYTSKISTTIEAGTSFTDSLKALFGSMDNTETGAIGNLEGSHKKPTSLFGSSFYLLKKNFGDGFFIDLNKMNYLKDNEYIKNKGGVVPRINSQTGLLGTPILQGTIIIVNMLFEPRINVASLVDIESSINPQYNGQFKVLGVAHSGIISEAQSATATTTLQLQAADLLTGELMGIDS